MIHAHLRDPRLVRAFQLLESDAEVQTYLRMGNVMVVTRLRYNDHGPVHSRIVAGSALEIFDILAEKTTPSSVRDGICGIEDAKLIVLCGAYLHDIGNAIHRTMHHIHGIVIADPILDRLLQRVYPDDRSFVIKLKEEILHCVFAHDEEVRCLSLEAGAVKVADGTDMAEGRARIPYEAGKVDIHSLSAISIRKVEIVKSGARPVQILVSMENPAGVFQMEHVLERKIETSGIGEFVEIVALEKGRRIKTLTS